MCNDLFTLNARVRARARAWVRVWVRVRVRVRVRGTGCGDWAHRKTIHVTLTRQNLAP